MLFPDLPPKVLLPVLSLLPPRDLVSLLRVSRSLNKFIEANVDGVRKFRDVSLQFKWPRERDVEIEAVEEDEENIHKLLFYIGTSGSEPVEKKRRRKESKCNFEIVDEDLRVEARRIEDDDGVKTYFCDPGDSTPLQVVVTLLKKFKRRVECRRIWSSCEYAELEKMAKHMPAGVNEVHILGEKWEMKEGALINTLEKLKPTRFDATLLNNVSISRHFFDSEVVQKLEHLEFHRTFVPSPQDYESELEDDALLKLEASEIIVHHTLLTASGIKKLIDEWKEGKRKLVKCDLDTAKEEGEVAKKLLDEMTEKLQLVSSRCDGEILSKLVKRNDGTVLNVSLRPYEERNVQRWIFVLLHFDESAVNAFMAMPKSLV